MDDAIEACVLGGNDEAFDVVIELIVGGHVPVDYGNSETTTTALMAAAARGRDDIVLALLECGASLADNVTSLNGWTAIQWAEEMHHEDTAQLLREATVGFKKTIDAHKEYDSDLRLLDWYFSSMPERFSDKIDLALVAALIKHIHLQHGCDEAILVFIAGYEDVVNLRDLITNDPQMQNTGIKPLLYTLHSRMQSSDHSRVFRRPPHGQRKIIIATNVAESSITIDDVVHLIDCGRVKRRVFCHDTRSFRWKLDYISQSCAIQRRGRAGRCRPGICYRLFPKRHFDEDMNADQPSEMLDSPLDETCLLARLLAPRDFSVPEFLLCCPSPIPPLTSTGAVRTLKTMDAFDRWECLTELGHLMIDLSVPPNCAKMVLYALVLKCLDPVLTIACLLSEQDPFMIPSDPTAKVQHMDAKKKLEGGAMSDHMVLLRAFQHWQKARAEGMERQFCERHSLSCPTMEMVVGMRTQLLGQLRASGFVRSRGGSDIRDLNANSDNWAVVKAALLAGAYPCLATVQKQASGAVRLQLQSNSYKCKLNQSSVLRSIDPLNISSGGSTVPDNLPSPFLFYNELTRISPVFASMSCATVVSPITVALVAGPARLLPPVYSAKKQKCDPTGKESDDEDWAADIPNEDLDETLFRLDDFLAMRCVSSSAIASLPTHLPSFIRSGVDASFADVAANGSAAAAHNQKQLILHLRCKLQSLVLRRLRAPSKPMTPADEQVIRAVVAVLTAEEQTMSIQQPSGIGQRPRPVASESVLASSDTEMDSPPPSHASTTAACAQRLALHPHQLENSQVPPAASNVASLFANNVTKALTLGASTTTTWTSATRPRNEAGGDCQNAAQQQAYNSAINHRQNSNPNRDAIVYTIVRVASHKQLRDLRLSECWQAPEDLAFRYGALLKEGVTIFVIMALDEAPDGSKNAPGAGVFCACLRLVRLLQSTQSFKIQWVRRSHLPYSRCVNLWHGDRPIATCPTGTELETTTGVALLRLWEAFASRGSILGGTPGFAGGGSATATGMPSSYSSVAAGTAPSQDLPRSGVDFPQLQHTLGATASNTSAGNSFGFGDHHLRQAQTIAGTNDETNYAHGDGETAFHYSMERHGTGGLFDRQSTWHHSAASATDAQSTYDAFR